MENNNIDKIKADSSYRLRIGNVVLPGNVILGPMAGATDLPFRVLCREQGAALVCMEMVSGKGISYHNKNTEAMLRIDSGEHPVSLQLFGNEPELMGSVVRSLENRDFDIIDLNMGCPVLKVIKNREGSALMKDPDLAAEVVRNMVKATTKPVTVKIRKGFDEEHVNAVEIAQRLEDAGAAAITIHGRTREQFYSGKADWDIIRKVKESVKIPVIGNGDVDSPEKAEQMLKETGCDGVMISRAALGNPWIFRRVSAYLETGKMLPEPELPEVKDMILRHTRMMMDFKGAHTALREMRSHVAWYSSGYPNSAELRRRTGKMSTYEELEKILEDW